MSESVSIEHRHLRSAIEFAVAMGDELAKRKQTIAVPRDLRTVVGKPRIPTVALGRLRRAIEGDERFRTAIAVGAMSELVDPIGVLWLQRPEGWERRVQQLVADLDSEAIEADLRTAARREEKRRHAAEQVAVRLRADLVERDTTITALRADTDALRADVVKAEDEVSTLRAELVDVRVEARHARDREAAAKVKLEAALATGTAVELPTAVTAEPAVPALDPAEIARVAQAARDLAARTDALLAQLTADAGEANRSARADRRVPLALPGGVIASSRAAAEFLLRSDAAVIVDAYNVAKLAWPSSSLLEQRERLLDRLENLARRFGTDVTVVFDGANVVGAHAARRRQVRVAWSPEGVTADDVIRDEVRRLPPARSVVVVTNDAEIVADVKALGANVVPSNALIAAL